MKSFTIEVKSSQTVTKEIEYPSFFKHKYGGVLGIINPENIYRVFHNNNYTTVQNGCLVSMKSDIEDSLDSETITEKEFFTVYNAARKATELNPVLK